MDIQEEREAFEAWYCRNHTGLKQSDLAKFRTLSGYSFSDSLKINISWEAWQAAKAQAVPNAQQALHDRLLVKSIREHVEGHISEISVNDLFDKGWLAAMKCIQNNIDMLELQDPAKAQAVLEKDAIIQKLSDQLYAQEMKTSAARVLCETACELLDGYAHQDAMVIINDLEQAMKEPTND